MKNAFAMRVDPPGPACRVSAAPARRGTGPRPRGGAGSRGLALGLLLLSGFFQSLDAQTPWASEVRVSEDGLREVTVRWPEPPAGCRTVRIERADTAEGPFTAVGETQAQKLAYSDRGLAGAPLADARAYFYRAVALGRRNEVLDTSPVLRATTAPPPMPPVPQQIEAHASRAVRLVWNPSPSPAVASYRVERTLASDPTGFQPVGTVSSNGFIDGGVPSTDLRDSTEYLYRAIAINRVGAESTPAAWTAVRTLPPPRPVTGLTATSLEIRCVPLAWTASEEADIERYDVYRAEAATGPFEKIGSATGRESTAYLDGQDNPGNLPDNAVFFYRVRAINRVTAESADSETVRAVTRAVPPEIAGVRGVAARPRCVPLSWNVSADEKVIGYEVWCIPPGKEDPVQVATLGGRMTTNWVYDGGAPGPSELGRLEDDADYRFFVVAYNKGRYRSSASAPVTVRTKKRPATPSGLKATMALPRSVNLQWVANPEPDLTEYVVEGATKGRGFERLGVAYVTGPQQIPTFRDTPLPDGTERNYRIKAVDRDRLESDWCEVAIGWAKPLPDAPKGLAVTPTYEGARLTWERPAQPDIVSYAVWKRTRGFLGSSPWELVGAAFGEAYVFPTEEAARNLQLGVSALDADGLESPVSEPLKVDSLSALKYAK